MKCWNDDNFLNTAPGIEGGDFVFKLSYSGTITTAMAVVLGQHSPEEAVRIAEEAAYTNAVIPGAKELALRVATLDQRIFREL